MSLQQISRCVNTSLGLENLSERLSLLSVREYNRETLYEPTLFVERHQIPSIPALAELEEKMMRTRMITPAEKSYLFQQTAAIIQWPLEPLTSTQSRQGKPLHDTLFSRAAIEDTKWYSDFPVVFDISINASSLAFQRISERANAINALFYEDYVWFNTNRYELRRWAQWCEINTPVSAVGRCPPYNPC